MYINFILEKVLKPLGAVRAMDNVWKFCLNVTGKLSSIFVKYHLHYAFNRKYKKSVLFI